jgi:arylsulfatase
MITKIWESLLPKEKIVAVREMECYAAALSHADYQVGRILETLESMGELDNTLVIYIMGDNGASAEDPTGLGMTSEIGTMGNKKIASHLGGPRAGMAMMWRGHIDEPGKVLSQFSHVTDIVPTILDAANIPQPKTINGFEQMPMNGTSLFYTFINPDVKETHTTQYFENIGNQGIYHDGWMASTTPKHLPWEGRGESNPDPFNDYDWELYNLKEDYSQRGCRGHDHHPGWMVCRFWADAS